MIGYIYLTENLINGRCYIGQHKAKRFDKRYKGSGKFITEAIKKYGWDNFVCQPIQWCETIEELNKAEEYWIEKCDAVNSRTFYNVLPGGHGALSGADSHNYGLKRTDEQRQHISDAHIGVQSGEKHPLYGKPRSEETKKKIAEKLRGRKIAPEVVERMAEAHRGLHYKKL